MNAPLFLVLLPWIFVYFHYSECLRMAASGLYLDSRVFVAFAGEDLTISGVVIKRENPNMDAVTCSDPLHREIYRHDIPATNVPAQRFVLTVRLRNLTLSGEYVCRYQTSNVFWFLHVRDHGYKEPRTSGNAELIPVAVITAVLLVFSVAGSVYVFKGNWKEQITKCGKTGGKQKQNGEERKTRETDEDSEIIKAPSASFYCSLQARPRSIYDVLEHSSADKEQEQDQRKPPRPDTKSKPPNTIQQTTQVKDEGVFESVYENF